MAKLEKAVAEVNRLWAKMCATDNVSVDSKFVVFSPNNPISLEYNKAVKKLFALRREGYAAARKVR